MIKNNNIQGMSTKGKVYFLTFFHLQTFIKLLKQEVKEEPFDLNKSNIKEIVGLNDLLVITKKKLQLIKSIVPGKPVKDEYWLGLHQQLNNGEEVTINNWKFKVI